MSERELFIAALQIDNESERSAYLDQTCAADPALKKRIEALLRAHFETDHQFERPLVDREIIDAPLDSGVEPPDTQATGVHGSSPEVGSTPISITAEYGSTPRPNVLIAGRYTLQEKIGEGGMGEVWVAKQSEPVKRKVALKLIKPGMDSRAVLQRFEQERQALAMMDHPNIAKVLDAGMTPNGQPFFVMELVNGLPLNKFCDELRLTPKDRLELFVPICQAVQHAHQKGIVHRDLKPANILITMIDGKPVPKVIDFGVAKATAGKLTDESMSTQFGAVVGTLEYMSPEQAGFSGEDIDTRADIYSLGVILYELLTGLRPIDAARLKKAALTEMIRIVREEEPSKPSTRLSTDESLPSMAAMRQIEPQKADGAVARRARLGGDEVPGEAPRPPLRDGQRPGPRHPAIPRRRRGGGLPAERGLPHGQVPQAEQGAGAGGELRALALVAGFIGTAWGLVRADRAWRAEATQRRIAVEAKTKAEASEALAKAQRGRAEQREEQAIDAVKKFRDAVADNPELKNNPALESLRKTLLKEPLAFFKALRDRLQADRDTRPESLARLAQASFDLGDLTRRDRRQAGRPRSPSERRWRSGRSWPTPTPRHPVPGRAGGQPQQHRHPAERNREAGRGAGGVRGGAGDPAEAGRRQPRRHRVPERPGSEPQQHRHLAERHRQAGRGAEGARSGAGDPQKLADANPTVTEFQRDLAGSHHNIGIPAERNREAGRGVEGVRGGAGDPAEAGRRQPRRHRVPERPGGQLQQHRHPAERDREAGRGA